MLFRRLHNSYCKGRNTFCLLLRSNFQLLTMNDSIQDNSRNIIKLTKDNTDIIDRLAKILRHEGVLALPTDTLYGVACLAQSTTAINRIYSIKGRNLSKPIAICVGEVEDMFKWGQIPEIILPPEMTGSKHNVDELSVSTPDGITQNGLCNTSRLLADLLPGPVTIVTERTEALNKNLNPGTDLVGIRIPDCDFIRELTNRAGEPLALTSANISSQMSPLCISDFSELHSKLDAVVDAGVIGMDGKVQSENSRKGSTVFRILPNGKTFQIIRSGCAYDATIAILSDKYGLTLQS